MNLRIADSKNREDHPYRASIDSLRLQGLPAPSVRLGIRSRTTGVRIVIGV